MDRFWPNKVIIINSNEELENYIECSEGSYLEIDFSKNILLLVNSTAYYGISIINKRLLQLSANEYQLDIEVVLNDITVVQPWQVALTVNKLSKESNLKLNITNIRY